VEAWLLTLAGLVIGALLVILVLELVAHV